MPKCSVKSCKNNTLSTLKKDGVSYFRYPKDGLEREKWRQIIAKERREEFFKPNDSSVVCSCHFSESDMYYSKTGLRKIKKQVTPHVEVDITTTEPVKPLPSTLISITKEPNTNTITIGEISLEPQPDCEKTATEISTKGIANNQSSSSQTLSDLLIFDSPRTAFFKNKLKRCEKIIELKTKLIQNLQKKNKRLVKRNVHLKEIVTNLKKKPLVNKSLNTDLASNSNESHAKIVNILTAKKISLAQYPPEFREFAVTLNHHSTAAYKYVRDVFSQRLPHPNTLCRWHKDADAQPSVTEEIFIVNDVPYLNGDSATDMNDRTLALKREDEEEVDL